MHLPEEHRQRLIETHNKCVDVIRSHDHLPEPVETAMLVEEHRWFWRPENVNFILVGESHVYTNEREIKVKIDPSRLSVKIPESIPLNFVKLVYCLGYGESKILDKPGYIESNPGTSQYVDLFRKCVGFGRKPAFLTTLDWKLRVLKAFREKGLWLLDASVHGCYFGKGKRLPRKTVKEIIPIAWNGYVKPVIDDASIDKKCVWIIGKSLLEKLNDTSILRNNWIYQPNARFRYNKEKHYKEKKEREQRLLKAIRDCSQ